MPVANQTDSTLVTVVGQLRRAVVIQAKVVSFRLSPSYNTDFLHTVTRKSNGFDFSNRSRPTTSRGCHAGRGCLLPITRPSGRRPSKAAMAFFLRPARVGGWEQPEKLVEKGPHDFFLLPHSVLFMVNSGAETFGFTLIKSRI